jgi:dihydropteroate synthase
MTHNYFRPLAFVYGADARAMIASGKAGALGGMGHTGFTHVEMMARGGASEIISFAEIKNHPTTDEIIRPRPSFAGLDLQHTHVMGIVNVTPDSFSDGGQHFDAEIAIAHGHELAEQGATILDIGGESTRPGSSDVSVVDERARILPVVAALAKRHVVSVDTRKAEVMVDTAKLGAAIINDVSALGFDAASAGVVAQLKLPVVLMHAQGAPRTMQLAPKYDDVVLDVFDWLQARINLAVAAGIPKSHICVDPGIGFGKTLEHNLTLLNHLPVFHGLGVGLLVGLSRKNMVGVLTGEKLSAERASGSVGGALQAALMGAHIVRVHDVKQTVQALAVFKAGLDPASTNI